MAIKMSQYDKVRFAKVWIEATKLAVGTGIDHVQGEFHLSRQECSTVAAGLRKQLRKEYGLELPDMPKQGRASTTTKETLADIAEMLK